MPTLSVVMIVKNESACLAQCLDSVACLEAEFVIGDTGSTDDTRAIAKQYGGRVIEVAWRNDFAEARNACLTVATGDWLLSLDADEVVDAESAVRIRELVAADGAGADAIEVTLANYCDAPHAWRWAACDPDGPYARGYSGYIPVGLLRLFRNGCGFEYREAVHENVTESVREQGGVTRAEPIVIHHYGFGRRDARSLEKSRMYLDIARKKATQHPQDVKAWHDLAELCFAAGDPAGAERASRNALEIDPRHVGAATMLANLLLNRGDLDEAKKVLSGFEACGNVPSHMVTALGAIACKQGRLDEARQRLERVLAADPNAVVARLCLARTLDRLGDIAGARLRLDEALAIAPKLTEIQNRFEAHELRTQGEQLFLDGQVEAALPTLVEALRHDDEDPLIQNDLGVVLNAMGYEGQSREALQRALRLAPDMQEAQENLAAL
ncbi:MAG TPA: tetratricopeptide repeat protein [Candidatus Hydrogenedentes bacterium]|nr:tetratricopeptide repeat protein [Candidatus Hydrogenedentota bacterium]